MKVFAIGSGNAPLTPEQRQQYMPSEVPATLRLYLDGKMDQFWFRGDTPGVVFLINAETVEEARDIVGTLPLAKAGILNFDFIPVGPLAPLGMLIA
ncbi:hypothetical protein GCM10009552_25750 [Rothia nasimurium]|uniref:Muconolactone isomerase domain-containing protein n=1 Tax=Luteibacter anthropi TaxID=564369 RepID=A0A7X5ZGS5_9GAMM|nr:hypothetical protein [Luteibacter anthropi]NII05014.1 hypothetical protein [Luteibacter anthropi]